MSYEVCIIYMYRASFYVCSVSVIIIALSSLIREVYCGTYLEKSASLPRQFSQALLHAMLERSQRIFCIGWNQ